MFEMEANHPKTVVQMLAFSIATDPIGADGKVTSGSGRLMWDSSPPTQLTRNFGFNDHAAPSAAACSIRSIDVFHTVQPPYCDELPQAILDVIAAEPTNAIAHSYRRYNHPHGLGAGGPACGERAAGTLGGDRVADDRVAHQRAPANTLARGGWQL
jgi:hypothetical protein